MVRGLRTKKIEMEDVVRDGGGRVSFYAFRGKREVTVNLLDSSTQGLGLRLVEDIVAGCEGIHCEKEEKVGRQDRRRQRVHTRCGF